MSQIKWIADQKTWDRIAEQLAQSLSGGELAIDTESNSLYAYREHICLVQIATSDETFLIDPLAVKDLSSLGRLLADPTILKVLHGSDYDLRCFDREYEYQIKSIFDTAVAARFLGMASPNLASVLETFLGVAIAKSQKLQRSNWALRPLNALAMEYAASDVRYLTRLAGELRRRLVEVNRLEWFLEECRRLEQIRYSPPEFPEDAFLRIKGSDGLKPGALAVLKELFAFREVEARRLDWPPFRVMRNETLLFLAQRPDVPLADVPGLSPWLIERAAERLRAAIDRGRRGPGVQRLRSPRRENPWTPEARALLHRLKRWRAERAAALGLDPALIWPASSLERLILEPDAWRTELTFVDSPLPGADTWESEVRAWQRSEFSHELKKVLNEELRNLP